MTVTAEPQVPDAARNTTFDAFVSYSHAADGKLAPAIRRGLQQLTKPWYRRRALTVFLDRTGLEVTPELWSTIVRALDASTYLVLLASPAAAASRWVNQEVEHWLRHRGAGTILPVLTAGEWEWDQAANDLDRERSTAVPPALFGAFTEEPAYLDLRWAAGAEHLDLRNGEFRDGIAQLAAPIHGKPKSELDGEDVRQYRRTRRVAAGAIIALVLLLIAATTGAIVAVRNAVTARQQGDIALSRQLAAQATVRQPDDPALGALLSLAARRFGDSYEADSGMLSVLENEKRLIGFVGDTQRPGSLFRAFSPDGTQLGIAEKDSISIWDVATHRLVKRLPVRSGQFAYTDDGAAVVTTERDGVGLWNVGSQTRRALLGPFATAITTGGGRIAAGYADGTVRVWDSRSGEPVATLGGIRGVIGAVAVSPDSALVAAGTDHLAVVWDAASGVQRGHSTVFQARPTGALAFDPSGTLLAMSAPNNSVHVWSWSTGFETDLTGGHRAGVQAVSFVAPGVVVSAGTSGDIVRWDLTSGTPFTIDDPTTQVTGVTIGPGATIIASGGFNGSTAVWQPDRSLAEPLDDPEASVLATDPRTTKRATLDASGVLTVRDPTRQGPALIPRVCPASEATFSPDDRQLAVACPSGAVQVWDLTASTVDRTLLARSGLSTLSVAYSPNGRRIAAALADGSVVVWNSADGTEVRRFATQLPLNLLDFGGQTVHVAFPDDDSLAYASLGTVIVRDVTTGAERTRLPTPSGFPVTSMALSTDRSLLAEGSQDGSVTLWNLHAPAEPVATFAVEPARVDAVAFSYDGRTLAGGTRLGQITLWDLAQKARRANLNSYRELTGAGVDITGIGFSGSALYTVGSGGLKRYELDPNVSQARLCRIVGSRDLTAAEWQAYVGPGHEQRPLCPSR